MNRLPPHSIDAEQGLLCSCLIDSTACGMCADRRFSDEHFHIPANAVVFNEIMEAWQSGRPTDYITLTQRLRDKGELDRIGGPSYITEIFTKLPTAANAIEYADILESKRRLRETIHACNDAQKRCYDEQDAADEIVEELAARVTTIATSKGDRKSMREMLKEKILRIQNDKPDESLLITGLSKLDRESPLRRGSMPLIAGERKAGKSMLAMTIAANLAATGSPVVYFTLEDPASEQLDRLIANISRVPICRHHESKVSGEAAQNLMQSISQVDRMKFVIRDDAFDIGAITAAARQEKAQTPNLAAIFVDYAQLVRAKTRKQDTRESEVATVSRALRLLAMELQTAVVVLSQLNKDGDTRESKSLEQDATAMWKIAMTDDSRKRLLTIPFQRNGESGVCFPLTFFGELCRYENFAP